MFDLIYCLVTQYQGRNVTSPSTLLPAEIFNDKFAQNNQENMNIYPMISLIIEAQEEGSQRVL